MAKNGFQSRHRKAAVALATVMAFSGVTACTKSPNKPNYEPIGQFIVDETEKVLFGDTLEQVIALGDSPYFNLSSSRYFSLNDLGFHDPLRLADFEIEDDNDRNAGPIFLKVSFVDGEIRVKDMSPDGMDESAKQWLLARVNNRKLFFEAVAKETGIRSLNLRINTSDLILGDDPKYRVTTMDGSASLEKEIDLSFPRHDPGLLLSAETFDQMLLDELMHLAFGVASEKFLDRSELKPEVERLHKACAAIREKAFVDVTPFLGTLVAQLDTAANATSDEEIKRALSTLRDYYASGEFTKLLPEQDPRFVETREPQFGSKSANCATNSLLRQKGMIEDIVGIEISDEQFKAFYDSDGIIEFFKADDKLYELLMERSIYKYFVMAAYNSENNFGHGQDNLNEQVSTAIVLLTSPMDVGFKLAYADVQDRELMVELIEATAAVLVKAFPTLAGTVGSCLGDLEKYLELQTTPVNEACSMSI